MKTSLQFCVMLLAVIAASAFVHAADSPSLDTPASLEMMQTLDNTDGLTAPTGRCKELADVATAAILKRDAGAKVQTYMRVREGKTSPRLIVVSPAVMPLSLTFASNCAVNSQFSSNQTALLTQLAKPAAPDAPSPLSQYMLADVCAHWTRLNHDWTDQAVAPPSAYKITMHAERLDVTYDVSQVDAYKAAVATLRNSRVNVAAR